MEEKEQTLNPEEKQDFPEYPWLKKYPKDIAWDVTIHSKPLHQLLHDTIAKVPHNPCINFLEKKTQLHPSWGFSQQSHQGVPVNGGKKGNTGGLMYA